MSEFLEFKWPTERAVKIKLGDGRFHIAVFADPNCPWCKRFFEESVTKVNDIEFYCFLNPVLGEDSADLSASIMASKDPGKAWLDWVMEEKKPTAKGSKLQYDMLAENSSLAEALGVETVPGIFLANGKGPYGFMTAMELISKIEQEY